MGIDFNKILLSIGLLGTIVGVFWGLILFALIRDDCNCTQKLCENNPNYDFCTVEKIIYRNQVLGEE